MAVVTNIDDSKTELMQVFLIATNSDGRKFQSCAHYTACMSSVQGLSYLNNDTRRNWVSSVIGRRLTTSESQWTSTLSGVTKVNGPSILYNAAFTSTKKLRRHVLTGVVDEEK